MGVRGKARNDAGKQLTATLKVGRLPWVEVYFCSLLSLAVVCPAAAMLAALALTHLKSVSAFSSWTMTEHHKSPSHLLAPFFCGYTRCRVALTFQPTTSQRWCT